MATLSSRSLRLTPQRQVVLSVLRAARAQRVHLSADEIYARARQQLPGISVATVYNSLRYLKEHGLVMEVIAAAGGAVRYDGVVEPHPHLLCEVCGAVEDLDHIEVGAYALPEGWESSGQLVVIGRCPECAGADRAGSA